MILANCHPRCGSRLLSKALSGLGLRRGEAELIRYRLDEPLRVSRGSKAVPEELFKLSDEYFVPGHVVHGELPCQMVLIVRNPRDAAVSWLRWRAKVTGRDWGRAELSALINKGIHDAGPWPRGIARFAEWADDPDVCVVRFEEIREDGGESVAKIARFVGAEPNPAVYEGLFGGGTWSGRLSDWREHWVPAMKAVWRDAGGPECEARLGYKIA